MSRIISKLVLAMLMLPAGAMFYLVVFVSLAEWVIRDDEISFLLAGGASFVLVVLYWVWLWRHEVTWTGPRLALTAGMSIGLVIACAGVAWLMGAAVSDDFGFFLWGAMSSVLWPIGATVVWRESRSERSARMRGSSVTSKEVPCPVCSYDLSGLREAACLECGGVFTIGKLLGANDGKSEARLTEGA